VVKGRSSDGRDPARDVEDRHQHAEQQDQHQPPQEIRHRQRHAVGHVDRPSVRPPRKRVPVRAAAPPRIIAMTSAMIDSSSVAGNRPSTRPSTGWRVVIEVPKSPCTTPLTQMPNWGPRSACRARKAPTAARCPLRSRRGAASWRSDCRARRGSRRRRSPPPRKGDRVVRSRRRKTRRSAICPGVPHALAARSKGALAPLHFLSSRYPTGGPGG
jgi:hypothetical protein